MEKVMSRHEIVFKLDVATGSREDSEMLATSLKMSFGDLVDSIDAKIQEKALDTYIDTEIDVIGEIPELDFYRR